MDDNIFGKDVKKLSASRIETLLTCHFSYYASYCLKLPNESNSGNAIGSAAHNGFEVLAGNKQKHEWKVRKIIEQGTVKAVPSIDRLLRIYCKKEGFPYEREIINKDKTGIVTVEEYIDPLFVTGLREDFYGDGWDELIVEKEHELDYTDKSKGIRFIVKGFIDKIHIKKNALGEAELVKIRDYKTTKQKPLPDKTNMQALIYQMFARELWPKAKEVSMDFIYLQFPKNPLVLAKPVDNEIIEGFKYYLSQLFYKINTFSEADSETNFAAHGEGKFLCGCVGKQSITVGYGKERKKVETEHPRWVCIFKEPYWYYRLSKADGGIIRTAKKIEDLKLTEDENLRITSGEIKVENLYYSGCPAFYPKPKA